MNTQYHSYKEDLLEFEKLTKQFYNNELSVKEYKGLSGRYGSYAQRGQQHSMLRLRMNGGQITKSKLKFITDSITSEHIEKLHFTTCQTVQLHNLSPDTVCKLMLRALDADIITWGGGGDYPRNVMSSPLSGVEQGEYFDVLPYATAATDYLLTLIDNVKLPRKLKVGFSNSPANLTHVTFRDLGFAATKDGTFDVYSAGGLGNNPKMGLCIARGVNPNMILYYIKAMIHTFTTYGNYENRGKSRTRYMQDTLGTTGYVAAFHEILTTIIAEDPTLHLNVTSHEPAKKGDGTTVSHPRVISQKQRGLYAVYYHPVGGTTTASNLCAIYDIIKDMPDVELRLTPNQGLYIINCTGEEALQVLETTCDGAENTFESSVACIGSSICQVGLRDSQQLLRTLIELLRPYHFNQNVLPQIHISGCTSSCGTHQIGALGFRGCGKVINKVSQPAFTLHINGNDIEGNEHFGESLGIILEEDISSFLVKLGQTIQQDNLTYDIWILTNFDKLKAIALEFITV